MIRQTCRTGLVLALIAYGAGGRGDVAAQSAGTAGQSQPAAPVFTTGVDLVTIDASVVDQQGNPVLGLAAPDFVLQVDGVTRPVTKIEFVRQDARSGVTTTDQWSTNEGAGGGRLILIVLDQSSLRRGGGQALAKAASRLLDDLGPGDRVGLALLPGGRGVDFTSHIALVRQRLQESAGGGTSYTGTRRSTNLGMAEALAVERGDSHIMRELTARECSYASTMEDRQICEQDIVGQAAQYAAIVKQQTQSTLAGLRQIIDRLRPIPGPKTMILVSEGLVVDRDIDLLAWLPRLSAEARLSLYAVSMEDSFADVDTSVGRASPSAQEDQRLRRDGLFMLAGQARGTTFSLTGGGDAAFQRLSRELTGYYVLGFEPSPGERDGKPHDVKVEVRRKGAEVRARRTFTMEAVSSRERTNESRLTEALSLPLLATEVGLGVATYNMPDPESGDVRVLLAADLGRGRQEDSPVVSLAYKVTDPSGRMVASRVDTPRVPDSGDQRYLSTFVVPAGEHTVKLAVVDADGRTGTVEHRFTAKLSDGGGVRLGELVLNDPVPGSDDALRPAVRPVIGGDLMVAYLELKPVGTAAVTARVEVAADANAPALAARELTVATPSPSRALAQGPIALATLPPGDYVARAIVSVAGKPVARLLRSFSFDPTSAVRARGTASAPGSMLTLAFDRSRVLSGDVLDYFLRARQPLRVTERPGVGAALEAARQGKVEALAEAIPAGDADPMAVLLRGVGLLARGELEPAAATFRGALRADSELTAATFYLGACYAAGGRDREAVGAWQSALAGEEEAPFIYTLASDAYLRLKDAEAALDLAQEAYDRWPEDGRVAVQFVRAAAAAGQPREALTALDAHLGRQAADAPALLLGMKIVYDAVSDGKAIDGGAVDQQRFVRYLSKYQSVGGPDLALAERWKKALWP